MRPKRRRPDWNVSAPASTIVALCIAAFASGASAERPWRLDDVIPGDIVSLSVNQRTRYEYLSEQFRVDSEGGPEDQALVLRTLVDAKVRPIPGITVGAEMQDSRAYIDDGTRLNTTIVNAVELLRAYAEFERDGIADGHLSLTGGRMTMNVGSRRFVARNRFRNTINGFTGIDLVWTSEEPDQTVYRAFWTLPDRRLPGNGEQAALHDNEIEFDQTSIDRQFWGLFASSQTRSGFTLDVFIFGLHENDTDDYPLDRNIFTAGGRLLREPHPGQLDYAVEFALQWGKSRYDTSSTIDLEHFAHFEHLEAGFSFELPWQPRLAVQWDYASGDKDPTDDKNGRFDTLFGARRFEFGPTGIYGPFARSNINSPGARIQVKPAENVTAFIAYRAFWLAQKKAPWVTTGVWDPTGESGGFIGNQFEMRVRWNPLPGNLGLEAGYAHLSRGQFARQAPNVVTTRASDYVYTQVTLEF
jgi:hypothetical protein